MKKLKASVVALLSVALLSACGNLPNPLGKSQDGSTEQTSTATDAVGAGKESDAAKAFDTGGFKTEPREAYKDPTPETGHISEAFLLAEYVPMPYEVDPVLSKGKGGRAVFGAGNLALIASSRAVDMLKAYDNRLQSGYYNSAEAPTARAVDPTMSMYQVVLRYDSPATAQEVAQKLAEESTAPVAEGELAVSYVPDSFPNMPNTYVSRYASESTGETNYSTFTPYNEYVISTWTATPVGQEQWSRDYVKKAYDKQIPLLEQFPGIKTPAGYGKTTNYPPHDPNNIAIYALQTREGDSAQVPGTYGPRGTASLFSNSKNIYDTLTQAGSVKNGKTVSLVFRADNDFGAQAILNSFMSNDLQVGAKQYDEPQGVPGTSCTENEEVSGTEYACYVINGRYVAEVSERTYTNKPQDKAEKKQLVSQMAAAQFEILKKADQKIENVKN